MIATAKAEMNRCHDEAAELDRQIKVLESEIDKKRNQLTVATPFEQTGEYARLAAKIERLRAGSGKTNELAANRIGTLQTELAAIDAQISAYMSAKERSATAAAQD